MEVVQWEIEEVEKVVEREVYLDTIRPVGSTEEVRVEELRVVEVPKYKDVEVIQYIVEETTVDRVIERPCSYKVVNEETVVDKEVIRERIKEVENIVEIAFTDTKVNVIE